MLFTRSVKTLLNFSRALSLCLVTPWFAPNAMADLQLCDGLWTNKSCEGNLALSLDEQPSESVPPTNKTQSLKKLQFHDLDMKNLRAKREFDVSVSIELARQKCRAESYSLDDCLEEIYKAEGRLESKVERAKKLKLEEEKLEVEKEANRLKKEENNIELIKTIQDARRIKESLSPDLIIITGDPEPTHAPKDEPTAGSNAPKINPRDQLFDGKR